jgi:hypothetical protein
VNEAVTPDGSPEIFRSTGAVKPFCPVIIIALEADAP